MNPLCSVIVLCVDCNPAAFYTPTSPIFFKDSLTVVHKVGKVEGILSEFSRDGKDKILSWRFRYEDCNSHMKILQWEPIKATEEKGSTLRDREQQKPRENAALQSNRAAASMGKLQRAQHTRSCKHPRKGNRGTGRKDNHCPNLPKYHDYIPTIPRMSVSNKTTTT